MKEIVWKLIACLPKALRLIDQAIIAGDLPGKLIFPSTRVYLLRASV
jgi:hypothetical protein